MDTRINDHSDRFNSETELGLSGTNSTLFPVIGALSSSADNAGMAPGMGPGNQIHLTYRKPTANTSLTWVHNNHTFKFGGEVMVDGYQMFNETYSMGWLEFSPNETSEPALNGVSLPSTAGFPYASFLLGAVDNGYDAVPTATNPLAAQLTNASGRTTSGSGYINIATTFSAPRAGQLVARFQF